MALKGTAWAGLEPPSVQILVVVANSRERLYLEDRCGAGFHVNITWTWVSRS